MYSTHGTDMRKYFFKRAEKAAAGYNCQGKKLKCVTCVGYRNIRCTVMGQNYLLIEIRVAWKEWLWIPLFIREHCEKSLRIFLRQFFFSLKWNLPSPFLAMSADVFLGMCGFPYAAFRWPICWNVMSRILSSEKICFTSISDLLI